MPTSITKPLISKIIPVGFFQKGGELFFGSLFVSKSFWSFSAFSLNPWRAFWLLG